LHILLVVYTKGEGQYSMHWPSISGVPSFIYATF